MYSKIFPIYFYVKMINFEDMQLLYSLQYCFITWFGIVSLRHYQLATCRPSLDCAVSVDLEIVEI